MYNMPKTVMMTIGHYNVQVAVTTVMLVVSMMLSLIIEPDVILEHVLSNMHITRFYHQDTDGTTMASRSNDMSFINGDEEDPIMKTDSDEYIS